MAEWNRRREAADSDSEAVEQVGDQRRPLDRLVDANSEVTGWNANEAMRKLRDMLFPIDRTKSADLDRDMPPEWKSDERFSVVDRHLELEDDPSEGYPPRSASRWDSSTWAFVSDVQPDCTQELNTNCVPTSIALSMRNLGIDVSQAGVTDRSQRAERWDEDGFYTNAISDQCNEEIQRAGRRDLEAVNLVEANALNLKSQLADGAEVLATIRPPHQKNRKPDNLHEVVLKSVSEDTVTVMDPWVGRDIEWDIAAWHALSTDRYVVIQQRS